MSINEIKASFQNIFNTYQEIDTKEMHRIFEEVFSEWESLVGWDESNSGKSWTNDELFIILSDAPTKVNCLKHAQAFKRGYGSIEQIYRWAATPQKVINESRPDDSFIAQIKRVAKLVGWRI